MPQLPVFSHGNFEQAEEEEVTSGIGKTLFSSTKPPSPQDAENLAAVMPALAGRALEAPLFVKTEWKPGQVFKEADDPDRTRLPWEGPAFPREVNPQVRAHSVSVEELPIPNRKGSFARVLRGVLTQTECAELLSRVNCKGFTPALLNVGMGLQRLEPYVRDGHRIIVDSPELTNWLTEVLRPHLPATMSDGSRLEALNERCRFLCYTPGQSFEGHTDGRYRRPAGHPKELDTSRITVQLYLHDVPAENGGATTFFPQEKDKVGHQPEAGSVLLFTQDLFHEGSLVKAGLKYTLRTEAMYTKR
eukprot:TRINITY_DN44308_c0_g1_i1.p1 TRINITY_DN44308_c0_g1~~TRINITY_DN44308_c0_g1_i1.p1  ORF type:complete len:303 (-),score=49.76 TRINITY_DN44308_c0_g1_i1:93-1001(-)